MRSTAPRHSSQRHGPRRSRCASRRQVCWCGRCRAGRLLNRRPNHSGPAGILAACRPRRCDALGPDRPDSPRAAGRPGGVRGAVPRAFGSGVRAVPPSHGRSGVGRGADSGRIRSRVGAAGHIPGRERVRLVALSTHRQRSAARAAGRAATGAAHRHDRRSGGARAPPAGDRRSGNRARSRACRRGTPSGSARGVRVARRRRVPARGDRRAHRHRGGNVEGAAVPGAPAVTRGIKPMMCPHMEARLNEYVDGTLPAGDRAAVEAHLAECAACRTAVAELRALVAGAASLPTTVEPGRDLWATIEARIVQRATYNVRRAFWRRALPAAAVLVIALGVYRLLPPSTAHDRLAGGGVGWAAVQTDFDRATDELSRALAVERGRLRPETVALLERNLAVIDAAIAESRAALVRDPANADLRRLFAAASRHKVELLEWATRVAAS